jgi:hypothetical protein
MVLDDTTQMDQLGPHGEKLDDKDAAEMDIDDLDHLPDVIFTRDEERAVMKKLDYRVVGLVALLYLLSFLDRSSKAQILNLTTPLILTIF